MADMSFSLASEKTDMITGISAMFAEDVVIPVPGGGRFIEGKTAAIAAMKEAPENAQSVATWTPIRGGISADGQHGFTYGYMKIEKPDRSVAPAKYLAYWVKQPEGWRLAVYKRATRPAGDVALDMRAPSVPRAMVRPSGDAALLARFRKSVADAEKEFSDVAQQIGLGPAFVRFGAPDAMNIGVGASFTFGNEAIARMVSEGEPATGSTLSWSADKSLAASSGDLGVTIGFIRPNAPPAAGQPARRFPFFTIWRRGSPNEPWRYVAE
jgi:ketosteroid isomerase-like protein